MKRNKHILINLTDDEYNALVLIAEKQRRAPSQAARLILIDTIESNIIKVVDRGGIISQPVYINEKKY